MSDNVSINFIVPGQRIIRCEVLPGKNDKREAMQSLTGNGFRLYTYFLEMAGVNDGKALFPFRWADVCEYTGMCRNSCFAAINELIAKGYLMRSKGAGHEYVFNGTRKR